nr:MAG TPA: hypothetical protein [Caudoviricetes sp.]
MDSPIYVYGVCPKLVIPLEVCRKIGCPLKFELGLIIR